MIGGYIAGKVIQSLQFTQDVPTDFQDTSPPVCADLKCTSLPGPEYTPAKLKSLMYDRVDVPSEFKYPDHGLLPLKGMLTADQLNKPNSLNLQGDHICRVIKRGFATDTTVGTVPMFLSHVRKYFATGNMESLELPILSHKNKAGTFSKGGDSGSLIVNSCSPTIVAAQKI